MHLVQQLAFFVCFASYTKSRLDFCRGEKHVIIATICLRGRADRAERYFFVRLGEQIVTSSSTFMRKSTHFYLIEPMYHPHMSACKLFISMVRTCRRRSVQIAEIFPSSTPSFLPTITVVFVYWLFFAPIGLVALGRIVAKGTRTVWIEELL